MLLLLALAAGCDSGSDPRSDDDALKNAPPSVTHFPSDPSAGPDGQGSTPLVIAPERRVRVHVKDKDTGRPATNARVRFYYTPAGSPWGIVPRETATNIEGIATFKVPPCERTAVRTEYSFEDHPVDLEPEGDTDVVLQLKTKFPLSGRVLDEQGRPVNGAEVFVAQFLPDHEGNEQGLYLPGGGISLDEFKRRFSYDLKGETKTDDEGRFAIEVKSCQTLLASAWVEGRLCPHWRLVTFDMKTGAYRPATLRLRPAARLETTCLDAMNRPLGGSMVTLVETERSRRRHPDPKTILKPFTTVLKSDEAGRIMLDVPSGIALALEGRFMFPAPAEGKPLPDPLFDEPLDEVTPEPGETLRLVAAPPKTVRLVGRVMDEEGKPLPGARIVLPVNSFMSDKEGRFSLLVPYNTHRRLGYEVYRKGFQSTVGLLPELPHDQRELALEITLKPAYEVRVRTDPAVEQGWLRYAPDPARDPVVSFTGCERITYIGDLNRGQRLEPGVFRFHSMVPGRAVFLAQKGRFRILETSELVLDETVESPVELDVTKATKPESFEQGSVRIRGFVRIPEGMHPHGLEIRLLRTDLLGIRSWDPLGRGKSNLGWLKQGVALDGRFDFPGLAPGRYTVAAAVVEWERREDAYLELEAREGVVEVELVPDDARGHLTVTVHDASGAPVPGVSMGLLDPADSPLARADGLEDYVYSDRDGVIRLKNLRPGRYGFSLSEPTGQGYLIEARTRVEAGAETKVDVVFRRIPPTR